MMRVLLLFLMFLLTLPMDGARPRRDSRTVRNEREASRRRQQQTRQQIRLNEQQMREKLEELGRLDALMERQTVKIDSIQERNNDLRRRSRRLADSVAMTQARVNLLTDAYAETLRSIRRQRQTASPMAYIFSSENFTQAWRRSRYLEELNGWARSRARQLQRHTDSLAARRERLETVRASLQAGIDSLSNERRGLAARRNSADRLADSLRTQGRSLERMLAREQQRQQRLDAELDRIIEAELAAERARREAEARERARREAEARNAARRGANPARPAAPREQTPEPRTPERMPSDFAAAKGRLPLPVDGPATIVSPFGRSTHSTLSKVQLQNNGIDLRAGQGASAVAVYPGTVSRVNLIDGFNKVVILRHGDYLTVYAGLTDLEVTKGQQVTAGQKLGKIRSVEGSPRLHFEIRHETEKLNPAQWLRH